MWSEGRRGTLLLCRNHFSRPKRGREKHCGECEDEQVGGKKKYARQIMFLRDSRDMKKERRGSIVGSSE